jgi:hypothetical protein
VGALMREADLRMLRDDIENGVRLARSFGLEVGDIRIPL